MLVNNAGIHRKTLTPRKEPPLADDGHEIHWRTNYLGVFHLTWSLLPLLQRSGLESGDARVVMTNLTLPQAFRGRMGKAAHRIGSALTSLVLLSPDAGTQTIVMCASAEPIHGGHYYERCATAKPSKDSRDEAVSRRLLDQSERWVRTLPITAGDAH